MTIERSDLSVDAVKINGSYIETLVTGYKTIKAVGREVVGREIEADNLRTDGSLLKNTKYAAREIEVSFLVQRDTMANMRASMESLKTVLDVEEAQIIFNGDSDCYFTGTPSLNSSITEVSNGLYGSFVINCMDPCKYALNEESPVTATQAYDISDAELYDSTSTYQVGDMVKHLDGTTMKLYECSTAITTAEAWTDAHWSAVTGMAFKVNNAGGYKTYPRFVVDFAEDELNGNIGTDGNSGFIQFAKVLADDTRYRLQFGDDEAELPVIASSFDIDFTSDTLGGFSNESSTTLLSFKDDANAVHSTSGVKPKYGSQSGWHGSFITQSVTAAADFELDFTQLISLTNKKQQFGFAAVLLDSSNNVIAGVKYTKSGKSGYTGNIDYIIGGEVKSTAKKQNFAKKGPYGYNGSKVRKGTSYIKRDGSTIIIKLAGDSKASYFYPATTPTVAKVGFFFVKNGTAANPSANFLRSAKFVPASTENAFNSGCRLEVDCSDASVLVDSVPTPEIGDVGNEWSDFYLDPGNNTIFVAWSDWTVTAPTMNLYYRKRWL